MAPAVAAAALRQANVELADARAAADRAAVTPGRIEELRAELAGVRERADRLRLEVAGAAARIDALREEADALAEQIGRAVGGPTAPTRPTGTRTACSPIWRRLVWR